MEIQDLLKEKIFTVSEFNNFVNTLLQPLSVAVEGEVCEWRVSRDKWIWFSLKDNEQLMQCFSLTYRIRQPVEEGMKVRVWGSPKIFGKSGKFSFVVERLELAGEGAIKRAYELLRVKLEKEGLFDSVRKRSLPRFPETLGLITSPQAAAYTDFMKHVDARLGGLKILFAPVAVQGASASGEVVAALDYFNERRPDVVVLTRGGGSMEDLQEFNSEEVVRAVFSCKVPVICAVGHERDVTLAELAADARASTPTHAAQLAVPDKTELGAHLKHLFELQKSSLRHMIFTRNHRLSTLTHSLWDALYQPAGRIKELLNRFSFAFRNFKGELISQKNRQVSYARLLASLSPENVLSRGYSIVKKSGKIIRKAQELNIGDNLDITLSDGGFETEVKKIT